MNYEFISAKSEQYKMCKHDKKCAIFKIFFPSWELVILDAIYTSRKKKKYLYELEKLRENDLSWLSIKS